MMKELGAKRPSAVVIAILTYGSWVWMALGLWLLWVGFQWVS